MKFIKVNKLDKKPYYLQIKDSIIEAITFSSLSHLEKLPTEKDVCHTFNLSRTVVRKAYHMLETEGYIKTTQGGGSIVIKRPSLFLNIDDLFHINLLNKKDKSFSQALILVDKKPESYALLGFKVDDYSKISFIVSFKHFPIMYQEIYMSKHYFKKIIPFLNEREISLSNLLKIEHLVFEHDLLALKANSNLSYILKLEKDDPVIHVKTTVYENDKEIARVESFLPGEYVYLEAQDS